MGAQRSLPKKLITSLFAVFALALATAIPASMAKAQPVTPIQHVVLIDLENDSFDHLLGFWCDEPQNTGRCPDGGMPTGPVTLSDGEQVSIWTPGDKNPDVEHNVTAQAAAIDGGRMDGWENITGPQGDCNASTGWPCMTGYQPSQLPNLTTLASGFAISDMTFTAAASPSWAGHMEAVAASQDGFQGNNPHCPGGKTCGPGWGCDSGNLAPWVNASGVITQEPSCVPDHNLGTALYPYGGAFRQTPVKYVPTIMDRLDAGGLSWRIYSAVKGTKGWGNWNICPTFAECLDTAQVANVVPDAQFLTDAAAGKLPAFSVVTPGGPKFTSGCHNGMSMTGCDNWIGQLAGAIETSPEWSSTAVFITFDDCGAFYDQVPPPVEPDGVQEGPRVPMIIMSPYARPGFTDRTPATFDGVLAFTEHTFGLAPLTAEDGSAYDFSGAFDYSQVPLKPARMVTRPLSAGARSLVQHPPASLINDPS